MQRWDVYISIKSKARQPVQSVIIKSIERNMECVYEARVRVLEFSNLVPPPRGSEGAIEGGTGSSGVGNFDNFNPSEIESSFDSSLTGSACTSTVSDVPTTGNTRSVQLPTSFSEDRLVEKTSFSNPTQGISLSSIFAPSGVGEGKGNEEEGGGGGGSGGGDGEVGVKGEVGEDENVRVSSDVIVETTSGEYVSIVYT